jgi:transposase
MDWADTTHDLWLVDVATDKNESLILQQTPEALDTGATAWRRRFGGRPLAVCLEPSRGPRISALLHYDCWVLYPLHPTTRATYREAFSPSRAQDEPQEAASLLARLGQHRDRLKAWRPAHATPRTRQDRVESRRRLVHDRTRLSHRLTAVLTAYFPQVLPWFDDLRTRRVCDLLLRWPTVEALKQVRPAPLEQFFPEPNSVRREPLTHRLAAITDAVPLPTDQAVRHASVLMITALATQMQTTIEASRTFEHQIAPRCPTPEDDHLLASLPGAGTVDAARLTAAMGPVRDRWTTGDEVLCCSGVAPVLERSGQATWSRWRYCCPKFRRQSFHEDAAESVQHAVWATADYRSQRARGKSHQAAVRALAFQWLRSIYQCWQTRTPYSAIRYLESLRQKGSPLLAVAANPPS